MAVEPNIKSHAEFNLVSLDEALRTADVVVVLVKHRQFGVAQVKAQLGVMRVLYLCGLLA